MQKICIILTAPRINDPGSKVQPYCSHPPAISIVQTSHTFREPLLGEFPCLCRTIQYDAKIHTKRALLLNISPRLYICLVFFLFY